MTCPHCGGPVDLKSPDYGRGTEFVCYGKMCGGPYGRRFASDSAEARAVSDSSRAASRAHADTMRSGPSGCSGT